MGEGRPRAARMSPRAVPRFRDPSLLVAGAISHAFIHDRPQARHGPALPRHVRVAVGHGRPHRQPAGPGGRPVRDGGGRLSAHRGRRADRDLPYRDGQALARRAGRVDPHRRDRRAGRAVSELLLHRGGVDLGGAGHPDHHRRRAGRLAPVAACLALTGLGLLVGLPSGFSQTEVLASAGMAVLAAAGFAAVTLTGARPVPGLDDLTVTGFGFTLGGLILLPLAAALGGLSFRPGIEAAGLLIALGTGPTAVAYTLFFRGLRQAAASTAALLALLEPLTGAILAALILGQRLTATGIAGAVTLMAAVVLTVRGSQPERPEPERPEPDQPEPDQLACR